MNRLSYHNREMLLLAPCSSFRLFKMDKWIAIWSNRCSLYTWMGKQPHAYTYEHICLNSCASFEYFCWHLSNYNVLFIYFFLFICCFYGTLYLNKNVHQRLKVTTVWQLNKKREKRIEKSKMNVEYYQFISIGANKWMKYTHTHSETDISTVWYRTVFICHVALRYESCD